MKHIAKPQEAEHAVYYEKFIALVDANKSVLDQLKSNAKMIEQSVLLLSDDILSRTYAEGKWTIKDILMHLIDGERVFLYRAMRFARNDKSPLPFFDENEFAKQANATAMPIRKILKEYKATRQATLAFFYESIGCYIKTYRHGE
jgi:uncharacterized damage-inducible protein DinB